MIQLSDQQTGQVRRLVLISAVATTFMLWVPLDDPINIPKMFVLAILSAWVLGMVLVAFFYDRRSKLALGQWAVLGLAIAFLLAALISDVRYTAFFGTSHRNNGALSYLGLLVLALAGMMSFNLANVKQLRSALIGTGAVLTFYGLLQTTHHDPFHWTLLYNPIVGTLGNPDFISALLGVCVIATLWFVLEDANGWKRLAGVALILSEIVIVKRSSSSQGLFVVALGFSVLVIAKLWQREKKLGRIALGIVVVGSIPVLLGMLNIGPLGPRIYRSSIQSRLDYWHAALSMFKAHPVFGIGLDRFGEYYGQYAPQVQIVQGQGSNNAHNVFLQLLATGGLLIILPYLFLLGVIALSAIRGIRSTSGKSQFEILALFSIWISLLLISSISIDNLGVAVWFWISGGALYGVTRKKMNSASINEKRAIQKGKNAKRVQANNSIYIGPLLSLALALIVLLFMVPTWRTSALLLDLQRNQGGLTKAQYIEKVNQVAAIQPKNVQTLAAVSDFAMRISEFDLGIEYAKALLEKDPRSIDGNTLSAVGYELSKKYQLAIPFRKYLMKIDIWSTRNMLELVKDYVQVKDMTNARAIAARIAELAPNGADATAAAALVKG